MSETIARLVDELKAEMERGGSLDDYRASMGRLGDAARAGGRETLDAAIRALAPMLPGLGGDFARTAVFVGACVEWGGSPLPLVEGLPQRAVQAMALNAMVAEWWEGAATGRPLPEPTREMGLRLGKALTPMVESGEMSDGMRRQIAMSWSDMDDWLRVLITVLARDDFRDALSPETKAEIREAAEAVGERSQRATWVAELAAVLDDEELLVLDLESRRGYALTMRGIGDTAQLHILLADRLIGDPDAGLLPGPRPDPRWVAAATDAPDPNLGVADPAVRAFRMFDGHGRHLPTSAARPADIQPLDGRRVLVLHPPIGRHGMGCGRVFVSMRPTLTLDRILDPAEVESWLGRVVPAVQDDFMAPRPAGR